MTGHYKQTLCAFALILSLVMPQAMAACTPGSLDLELVSTSGASPTTHAIAKCFSSMSIAIDSACTLTLTANVQNNFVQALFSAGPTYTQLDACPAGASLALTADATDANLGALLSTSIYPSGMTAVALTETGTITITVDSAVLKFRPSAKTGSAAGIFTTIGALADCSTDNECVSADNLCAAGSYSVPIQGQTTYLCALCASGTYSDVVGATACTQSLAGKALPAVGSTAAPTSGCNAGTFATLGSSDCRPCAPGTFASAGSASSCTSCPDTWYSHTYGATACVKCTYGRPAVCASSCSSTPGSGGSFTATVSGSSWTSATALADYSYPALLKTCSPADTLLSFTVDETCAMEIRALAVITTTSNGQMCSDPSNGAAVVTAYYVGTELIMNRLSSVTGNILKIAKKDATAVTMSDFAATSYPGTPTGTVTGDLTVDGGNLAGAGTATTCPAGTYITGATTTLTCTPCEPGTYCASGAINGDATCAVGTSSTMGQAACTTMSDCGNGYQFNPVTNACECAPGHAGDTCSPCGVNEFSPGGGVACAICTGGLVSAPGSESWGYCPAGEGKVNGVCTRCEPGEEPTSNGSGCVACVIAGFYNPDNGSGKALYDKCQRCDGGKKTVDTGTILKPAMTGCIACEAGTYATWTDATTRLPSTATTCASCPDGGYSAAGAKRCTPCAGGSQKNSAGDGCEKCGAGTYRSPYIGGGCSPCPAGTAAKIGSDSCTTCNPGQYSPGGAGAATCSSCAEDKYSSDPGSTICVDCPVGFSTLGETGAAECSGCPAGTKYNSGTKVCDDCPIGWYQDREGQSSCKRCPIGKFSDEAGSTTCDSCPAGKYQSVTGSTSCRVCPGGTFSSAGKGSCSICAKGKYSAPGSTACKSCAAGYYANKLGSRTCTACPAGSKCPGVGNDGPDLCPAGSFQSKPAQTTCTACPKKTYASKAGATKCTACASATTVGSKTCSAPPPSRRLLFAQSF